MVQGLNLGLGIVQGLNWGLPLEELGRNLKRGTGTGYDRGTSHNLGLGPLNWPAMVIIHIYTLETWPDNALLIIADNVPDTSGMML